MPVIKDVVCTLCGCLCDDLEATVEDNRITKVGKACKLGRAKTMGPFLHERIEKPMIRKNGKESELEECSYDEAITKAAEILVAAKRPMSYGWCSTSCEAIEKAILLAEETGSLIDSTANVCHGPSALAAQEKGAPTCSLGTPKNYADLVIFWGCNPVHAHPRHQTRYSTMAKGKFTPNGKKDRKMIVIDPRNTDTAKKADLLLQLKPGSDYVLIEALRATVNGHEDVLPDEIAGLPKEKVLEAAEMCKAAKFGVLYFGMGITQTRGRYKCGDNVSSLMSDLNQITKFVMIGMRGHYNVTGFGQVASWETGFPMAIDFSRGYPYYNPGETGTNDVLMRREVDAFITGAADPGAHFPQESVKHLFKIPAIQIDGYANPTTEFSDVVIPAAIAGVECDGTAYRMDCQPIRMKKLVETTFKSDEEILTDLINKVRELKGAEGAKGGA